MYHLFEVVGGYCETRKHWNSSTILNVPIIGENSRNKYKLKLPNSDGGGDENTPMWNRVNTTRPKITLKNTKF